jgi:hypothetical protein
MPTQADRPRFAVAAMPSRRQFLHLLIAAGFALAAGAAIAQGTPAASPAIDNARRVALEKRVAAYWAARKGSDLGAAYAYYSPAFRAGTTRPDFLRNFQRLIRFPPDKFAVDSVDIQPEGRTAIVKVRLELTRSIEGQNVPLSVISEETWVFVDRNWWKKEEPLAVNV